MNQDDLIARLVADLHPVRPLSQTRGLTIVGLAGAMSCALVISSIGIRADLANGSVEPLFLIASGLFLLLGVASSYSVVGMGRPYVGSDHQGWLWAALMTAILPVSAIIFGLFNSTLVAPGLMLRNAVCLTLGVVFGLIVGVALTLWTRRGAVTAPDKAGLLIGLASGSFGIFCYGLHCPNDSIIHIGTWHIGAVVVSAGLGRLIVPRLIRW